MGWERRNGVPEGFHGPEWPDVPQGVLVPEWPAWNGLERLGTADFQIFELYLLLGKECHDIDIALEDMLGKAFCDKVNEYFISINQQARNVSVIQSNPDQSKHLETARMKIFGVEIDFVNLRAETYAENSRIPSMKFGTPEEDALRRDLTINSLFYNINTGSVEDFTGRGLSDLCKGIIATPLPPKTTFLDDPLRVLRAVRFAARFDYIMQEDLREAAANLDVRTALLNKISPERVGVEIDLMISGANPVRAMQELVDLDLFWVVFRLPQELKNNIPYELKRLCLGTFKAMFEVLALFGAPKLTPDQRRIGFYAALLLPLKPFNLTRKNKQIPVASTIMRDSLKLRTQDANVVVDLHNAADGLTNVLKVLFDEEKENLDNAEAEDWEVASQSRKMIRTGLWIGDIKELWRVALLLESLTESTVGIYLQTQQVKEKADRCLAAEAAIINLGLENVWELKPLLNGKDIMSELGLEKGGPEIKEWQMQIRKWQLCHMQATVEECLEWFRASANRQRSKKQ
ncbi:hypothetical protein GOP47_0024920 [Adiantum capillus-veneris]|uniref:Poly A polymerase head domain-containing protein n=1 Tax=Adiantum capillus-veneris TaxID=13818 RepID=A0A9D4U309_ADICA|nr:hypothetical protein GOP47_0024920 [Adiantum capillus-veneris]